MVEWAQFGEQLDACWKAEVDGVLWLLAWYRGRWWLWRPSRPDDHRVLPAGPWLGVALDLAEEAIAGSFEQLERLDSDSVPPDDTPWRWGVPTGGR